MATRNAEREAQFARALDTTPVELAPSTKAACADGPAFSWDGAAEFTTGATVSDTTPVMHLPRALNLPPAAKLYLEQNDLVPAFVLQKESEKARFFNIQGQGKPGWRPIRVDGQIVIAGVHDKHEVWAMKRSDYDAMMAARANRPEPPPKLPPDPRGSYEVRRGVRGADGRQPPVASSHDYGHGMDPQ